MTHVFATYVFAFMLGINSLLSREEVTQEKTPVFCVLTKLVMVLIAGGNTVCYALMAYVDYRHKKRARFLSNTDHLFQD